MEKHFEINKAHLNSNNTLFGGELMKWMDDLAHKSAMNYIGGKAVTTQVKELTFLRPVYEGNNIVLQTKLINTHGCLMTFEIESYVIDKNKKELNANAIFIMASINNEGKPQRIPRK